jgi:TPR repeat protein
MTSLAWLLAEVCDPPDVARAREWAEKAADSGHSDAMGWLGFSYLRITQPPDLATARSWYERAADTGDIDNMYNLGMFLAEFGGPSTHVTARYWLRKAAQSGHAGAAIYLAQWDSPGSN